MDKKFQQYTLGDFLDDADFCGWARSERPDLDDVYRDLLKMHPEQKAVFQRAGRLIELFDDAKSGADPVRKLQIWEEVHRIYEGQRKLAHYRQVFRYAAILTLFFATAALAGYLILEGDRDEFTIRAVQAYAETRLTLNDGRKIDIPSERAEIVYPAGGEQVEINGEPVVIQDGSVDPKQLNELIVPFGRQSKLVLADGTEVWLNAGSRLVFPSRFGKGKRKVQLQGEAFFIVTENKSKPFSVETNHSVISVLGTSFNVKAYPDEKTEETVLVEGSVRMNLGKSVFGEAVLLKPDQRIVAGYPARSYTIADVNVQNYTSWTGGMLTFKDEALSVVLTRIARFYNIRVRCEVADKDTRISGKLDLKQDYQRVLDALEPICQGEYSEKNGIVTFRLNKDDEP